MKKIPVIIDCDPGVDDSYALALANSYEGFDSLKTLLSSLASPDEIKIGFL